MTELKTDSVSHTLSPDHVIEAVQQHHDNILSHLQSRSVEEQLKAIKALKHSENAFISKLLPNSNVPQTLVRKILRPQEAVDEAALVIKEKDLLRMKAIIELGESYRRDVLKAPIHVEKEEWLHRLTLIHQKFHFRGVFKIDRNAKTLSIPVQESFTLSWGEYPKDIQSVARIHPIPPSINTGIEPKL